MAGLNANDTQVNGNVSGVVTLNPGDKITSGVQYYNLGGTTYQNSQYQAPGSAPAPTTAPQPTTAPTSTPPPTTTPPVNTSQPNPATTNATPYTGDPEMNPSFLYSQPQNLTAAGLAAAKASGTPPPQDAGAARSAVASFTPPPPPNTANITTALAQDPGYQKLVADAQNASNVLTQQTSLLDTYKKMEADAGLPALDTQLLNTQKIINGTEQDIRNEVQATGGFATDSQVMALSSARNKTLIQNYNNLLATKTNAENQINTMIGLAGQDRQNAIAAANQQLNIDSQIADYRQKFISNAQQNLKNVIDTVGYSGLYAEIQNDPNSVALTEQTLGLQPGQLQTLASQQSAAATKQVLAQYNITSPYVLSGQTVINSQTGASYSSPQDFQQQTGMSLDQANAQGLIKPLGATSAQEQQQFDNQIKMAQLGISQAQLGVSQYNAETSRINALKTSGIGTPNAPGYDAQGQKYTTGTATPEVLDAFKPMLGGNGTINSQEYQIEKAWWVAQDLSAADFDAEFQQYIDKSSKTWKSDYGYGSN